MPGTVLEAWDMLVNKSDKQKPLPIPPYSPVNNLGVEGHVGSLDNKEKPQQISKSYSLLEGEECFGTKSQGKEYWGKSRFFKVIFEQEFGRSQGLSLVAV